MYAKGTTVAIDEPVTGRSVIHEAKPWYQSKTFWFNVVTFVLGVLALTEFVSVLPKTAAPYIALANAVGNLILRLWFTDTPVTS